MNLRQDSRSAVQNANIRLFLRKDDKDRIARNASEMGITMSALIRLAVFEYLDRRDNSR